jgi:acyl-CoA dehydrogenase
MTATTNDATDLTALRELADDIFAAATEPVLDRQDVGLRYDPDLWDTLAGAGLALLTTPETHGGSGAGLAELAVVLESCGYHAAPVPLAESDLLASWLLRTAGMDVPAGAMTAALTDAGLSGERLVATVDRIPWAHAAQTVVLTGPGFVTALSAQDFTAEPAADIAGQPNARLVIDTDRTAQDCREVDRDLTDEFRLRGAWARSLQTAGALTRALELSIAHAGQREQFGRPIARFQAVQALIAGAASALAVAKTAAYFATDICSIHGFDSPPGRFAVSVAKIESARAATIVARNAHQVHGAIGFTLDHRLRHFTSRALAWRSEFGTAGHWRHQLGQTALESGSDIWSLVTRLSSTSPC